MLVGGVLLLIASFATGSNIQLALAAFDRKPES
jgi:hypothetical protein